MPDAERPSATTDTWAAAFLTEWSRPYFGDDSADALAVVTRAAVHADGIADRAPTPMRTALTRMLSEWEANDCVCGGCGACSMEDIWAPRLRAILAAPAEDGAGS